VSVGVNGKLRKSGETLEVYIHGQRRHIGRLVNLVGEIQRCQTKKNTVATCRMG
jgi:hypothetical protein